MKRFIAFAAAVVGLVTVCGCRFSSGSGRSYSFSGELPASTNFTVRGEIPAGLALVYLDNRFGKVHVVGTDEAVGSWSWTLTARAKSDEEAARAASETRCEGDRLGDRFRIAVTLPESFKDRAYVSDIEVRVPRAMGAQVNNSFGRTELGDLDGAVEVAGQNCAVELRNIGGAVNARTSFASLTATRIGPAVLKNQNGKIDVADVDGTLEASTSFASMSVRNISGAAHLHNQNGQVELDGAASAEIRTSFAGLSVSRVTGGVTAANQNGRIAMSKVGGAVDARTSFAPMEISGDGTSYVCRNQNGAIRLDIASDSVSNITASTSFAAIDVSLPAGLKPAIQAHTRFADIDSDFPVLLKPKGSEFPSDLEPGAPRIRLDTQNAPIRIAKK